MYLIGLISNLVIVLRLSHGFASFSSKIFSIVSYIELVCSFELN